MKSESVTVANGGLVFIFRETNQLTTDPADIAKGAVPLAVISIGDGVVTLIQKARMRGFFVSENLSIG